MVIMASGITCGRVRTTTTESRNMAAILQKSVDRDIQPWFAINSIAEICFFDVTVTGLWSSPLGCPDFDRSTKVSLFCVVLGRKYS